MYVEASFKAEIATLLPTRFNNAAHISACWAIYKNAANPDNRRLVAGLMDDLDMALNKLGKTTGSEGGSVLRSPEWSIVLNDAWVLGGIHGHVNFELISTNLQESIINQSFKPGEHVSMKFRVTGRELIGLTTFGYAQVYGPVEKISDEVRPDALGGSNMLFQCVDPVLADTATFTRYNDVIDRTANSAIASGWSGLSGLVT